MVRMPKGCLHIRCGRDVSMVPFANPWVPIAMHSIGVLLLGGWHLLEGWLLRLALVGRECRLERNVLVGWRLVDHMKRRKVVRGLIVGVVLRVEVVFVTWN